MSIFDKPEPKPLPKVPQMEPPKVPGHILHVDPEDAKDAYEEMTEAEVSRIEYEEAKAGKIPLSYKIKQWVIGAVGAGIVGIAFVLLKGC